MGEKCCTQKTSSRLGSWFRVKRALFWTWKMNCAIKPFFLFWIGTQSKISLKTSSNNITQFETTQVMPLKKYERQCLPFYSSLPKTIYNLVTCCPPHNNEDHFLPNQIYKYRMCIWPNEMPYFLKTEQAISSTQRRKNSGLYYSTSCTGLSFLLPKLKLIIHWLFSNC